VAVRVIALGQDAAGDDAVAFAVLEEVRRRGAGRSVELIRIGGADALLTRLDTPSPVVLADAAVGLTPGDVVEVAPDALAGDGVGLLSSHGLGVREAIELIRLTGGTVPPIRIVAIGIQRPCGYGHGLSPAVAASVNHAADTVLALVESLAGLAGESGLVT
jgi:hydrogenase maturation protease